MAEEWANNRCPEQGPEFIIWCMCKEDFLAGYAAAQQKWISVKERLPEKQMVLCNCKDGYELGYYGRYGQEQWHNTLGTDTLQVTHWMPLPELPKENE